MVYSHPFIFFFIGELSLKWGVSVLDGSRLGNGGVATDFRGYESGES